MAEYAFEINIIGLVFPLVPEIQAPGIRCFGDLIQMGLMTEVPVGSRQHTPDDGIGFIDIPLKADY